MYWRPEIRNRAFDWMGEGFRPLIDRNHFLGHSALDFPSHGRPTANFAKQAEKLVLEVAVPGFAKEDLAVTLLGDVLTVRGTRQRKLAETGVEYVREEFSLGPFERRFRLAEGIGDGPVEARCENGVLRVTFFDEGTNLAKQARRIAVG